MKSYFDVLINSVNSNNIDEVINTCEEACESCQEELINTICIEMEAINEVYFNHLLAQFAAVSIFEPRDVTQENYKRKIIYNLFNYYINHSEIISRKIEKILIELPVVIDLLKKYKIITEIKNIILKTQINFKLEEKKIIVNDLKLYIENNKQILIIKQNYYHLSVADELIEEYRQVCNCYLEHLCNSITSHIKKIKNWDFLRHLSNTIKDDSFNFCVDDEMSKDDMIFKKTRIAYNLCASYPDYSEDVDELLFDKPAIYIALKKYKIIVYAQSVLNQAQNNEMDEVNKLASIEYFKSYINKNQGLLMLRRDTFLFTFLKAVGVIVASACTAFIGTFFAYRFTFGNQATHGHQFIEKITKPHFATR